MVSKIAEIAEKVFEKIKKEEVLYVSFNCGSSHMIDAVIPDKISTENNRIYIEGENLILNITNEEEFKVIFDDIEDEFIIKQGNVTYYLS